MIKSFMNMKLKVNLIKSASLPLCVYPYPPYGASAISKSQDIPRNRYMKNRSEEIRCHRFIISDNLNSLWHKITNSNVAGQFPFYICCHANQ